MMLLGNFGCGGQRPQGSQWLNVDQLRTFLKPGTPERENLDREGNYVEADLSLPLPFVDEVFDAIIAQHVIEHMECHTAVAFMKECRRVLKVGGILLISVPDVAVFRAHFDEDTVENAPELFGEPIYLPDGARTFRDYALWHREHKALFTQDVLWAYFVRAGFTSFVNGYGSTPEELTGLLNRIPFSLIMQARKTT